MSIPVSIPHTQRKLAIIDSADAELVNAHRWIAVRTSKSGTWYARTRINGKPVYMHRLILFGDSPSPFKVDHINGNGLDNRRSNLRPVTVTQNARNSVGRKKARKSKFKGVSFRNHPEKPYRATIEVDGTQLHLGYFSSEEDAARAYDDAAKKQFGRYARLNFPEDEGQEERWLDLAVFHALTVTPPELPRLVVVPHGLEPAETLQFRP